MGKLIIPFYILLLQSIFGATGNDEEMANMKIIINQLVKQNEVLQKRMTTITTGMTEMCRAVNIATCGCDQEQDKEPHEPNDPEDFRLLSFESQGEKNGSVQLTLKFEATDECDFEWTQTFTKGNGQLRSRGQLKKTKQTKNLHIYQSELQLHDIEITQTLSAMVYTLRQSAIIEVNLTAITLKGKQNILDLKNEITYHPRRIVLQNDLNEETNVTLNIGRSVLDLAKQTSPGNPHVTPEVFASVINTTSDPDSITSLYGDKLDLRVSHIDNGVGDIKLLLTISTENLGNGGQVFISLRLSDKGLIEAVKYYVHVDVVLEGLMTMLPSGSIALYDGDDNVYVMSSVISVSCFAMGNPVPDVTVYKESKGQQKELRTETISKDDIGVLKSVILKDLSKNRQWYGVYVCRASNGNETIETRTNLLRYKPIEFDERKTGVTVNTTDKVVVTCKASGNPTPELEIRLGANYGPNLLTAEGNFTSKIKTKGGTSKAVITFSPPDHRIDVVYCYVFEEDVHFESKEREIRIYPETHDLSFDRRRFFNSLSKLNL